MKESFEQINNNGNREEKFKKYSPEDIKFFNKLADKYGLEQDEEFLIVNKNDKQIFIPKSRGIPTKSGSIRIEDLIEQTLAE